MTPNPSRRTLSLAAACVLCGGATATVGMATRASASSGASLPSPRRVITAVVQRGTAHGENRMGAAARLPSSAPRVFADSATGFATVEEPLSGNAEGAVYPVRTTDGGRRWTIDGPPFLLPGSAQAGIVLGELGIADRGEYWAYGPASQVLEVTDSAGRRWYQVPFGESVQSVSRVGRFLLAYVDATDATGSRGATWQYVSSDGGRVWRYTTRMPPV